MTHRIRERKIIKEENKYVNKCKPKYTTTTIKKITKIQKHLLSDENWVTNNNFSRLK